MEEEGNYENDLRPEDLLEDEDAHYRSEEEHAGARLKEKPLGPPVELEIPLRPPPAPPSQVFTPNVIFPSC